MISAIIGIGIAKALSNTATDAYLLAPLACGLASSAMTLTGTVHPPGGATAVLAVADPTLRALGWNLIPLIAISAAIIILSACLLGNMFRRYPVWWWTVGDIGFYWKQKAMHEADPEQGQITGAHDTLSSELSKDHKSFDLLRAQVLISDLGVIYPPGLDLSEEELLVLEAIAAKLESQ